MRRSFVQMRSEFMLHWKHYVLQSLLASGAMALVLLFLTLQNAVIVASIGATSFIIFAMPKSVSAAPMNVIGGHVTGLVAGILCNELSGIVHTHSILVYSMAVGISIFVMVVLDVEHPPAAGTALGVAITGFNWPIVFAVITSITVLSLIHHFCKKYIRDLV